jgi:predicted RNA methylase
MNTGKWFLSDAQFHQLYPAAVMPQASMHWTPLNIARKVAEFLAAEKDMKILDIGSGAGKFCLAAAYYKPDAFFYGIEQRPELVACAENARFQLQFQNVFFTEGNITQFDLTQYDHYYFYNSFHENIEDENKIDDKVTYSRELYYAYNRYLCKQLEKKASGTRLATFHAMEEQLPAGYHEVGATPDELLKFWIKI